MSFTATATFSFGSSKTGLTDLRAQARTASATTGSVITTGFVEIGRGIYTWSGSVPDDAVFVHAYSNGTPTILDVAALTPSAAQNAQATRAEIDSNSTKLAETDLAAQQAAESAATASAAATQAVANTGQILTAVAAIPTTGAGDIEIDEPDYQIIKS